MVTRYGVGTLAALLLACLPVSAQQENSSQQQRNRDQQQQDQQQNQQQGKVKQISIEDGRTIALPSGSEVLQMTVATPDEVRGGQRYQYKIRLKNTSENVTLSDVKLMQHGADVQIADAQPQPGAQSHTRQRRQGQQNQQAQEQQQQGQQGQANQPASGHHWMFPKIKPGHQVDITVTAVAGKAGKAEHCFAVTYNEALCIPVSVINPTVEIKKSGPDVVGVCEEFQYRYELTNTGTGTAENFIVRDALAKELQTASGEPKLEFRVDKLDAGETRVFVADLRAMKAGNYSSRANVQQKGGETHESSSVQTRVIEPEIEVQISAPRAVKVSENASMQVTLKNVGEVPARNTRLQLKRKGQARVTNADGGDTRGDSLHYAIGDIAAGESVTRTLQVSPQQAGDFEVTAIATTYCADDRSMELAKAETSVSTRVLEVASLLLTAVDTSDVIAVGNEIEYRVRVQNQGNATDTNLQLSAQLPSELEFVEVDGPSEARDEGGSLNFDTIKQIEPGQSLEWLVTAKATEPGEVIFKVTATSDKFKREATAEEPSTLITSSESRQTSSSGS
jgi:uncharacterized repeat protein (TIGR01451 family)